LEEVIGIPVVLLSISEINGRGYQFFTMALLGARYSTHIGSPPCFCAKEIGAAAVSVYLSHLLVSLALDEIS